MTLRTLVKKMDKAYYNDGMLIEILDHPRHNVGDGLAAFIVHETKDVIDYSKKKLSNKDIATIKKALEKAEEELGQVIASLPA